MRLGDKTGLDLHVIPPAFLFCLQEKELKQKEEARPELPQRVWLSRVHRKERTAGSPVNPMGLLPQNT